MEGRLLLSLSARERFNAARGSRLRDRLEEYCWRYSRLAPDAGRQQQQEQQQLCHTGRKGWATSTGKLHINFSTKFWKSFGAWGKTSRRICEHQKFGLFVLTLEKLRYFFFICFTLLSRADLHKFSLIGLNSYQNFDVTSQKISFYSRYFHFKRRKWRFRRHYIFEFLHQNSKFLSASDDWKRNLLIVGSKAVYGLQRGVVTDNIDDSNSPQVRHGTAQRWDDPHRFGNNTWHLQM